MKSPKAKSLRALLFGDGPVNYAALIKKWWFVALFVIYAVAAILFLPNCASVPQATDENSPTAAAAAEETPEEATPTPAPSKEPTYTTAKLAYAGDLVCHMGINEEAFNGSEYDYVPIMEAVRPYLDEADYAFCCMETTFPDDGDISGYPCFHSPRSLATSLKDVGFDLIELASNHCLDAHQDGLISTLDVLDAAGLEHIGTYRTQEERNQNHGIVVKEINGISIAFLDYTYGTNGFPVTGFEYAVNLLFKDYLEIDAFEIDELDYETLDADLAYARSLDTDLIVAMMHWGLEYFTSPVDYQKEVADHLFEQGVDLILGGHPHVPEPMEVRRVRDLDGNERTGYICYCMGNFLSCMNDRYTNLTGVTTLELEKNEATGETYLKNVDYAPMIMVDTADHGISWAGWRYKLVDLHKAMDSYAAGDDMGYMNDTLYYNMQTALDDVHSIFGARFDRYDPGYQENTEGEIPLVAPAAAPAETEAPQN